MDLLKWFDKNQIVLNPDVIIREGDSGKRLEARKLIPVSSVIGSIPKESILSRRTTSLNISKIIDLDPNFVLTLVLLHEISLGEYSKWFGYIETLPKKVPVCLFWKSDAIKWIQGTQLGTLLEQSTVKADLETFYKTQIHLLPHAPSLAEFYHAYTIISSRAFLVDSFHALSLVPLADLFNHEEENNLEVRVDYWVCEECGRTEGCVHDGQDGLVISIEKLGIVGSAREDIELMSISNIEAGQEIFNHYEDLSNSELLMEYGFQLEGNGLNRLDFKMKEILEIVGTEGNGSIAYSRLPGAIESWGKESSRRENEFVYDDEEEGMGESMGGESIEFGINSEAAISRSLWLYFGLCGKTSLVGEIDWIGLDSCQNQLLERVGGEEPEKVEEESDGEELAILKTIAKWVIMLCQARIRKGFEPDLSGSDVLDLAEIERDVEVKLAIKFVADERMQLECTIAKWTQFLV